MTGNKQAYSKSFRFKAGTNVVAAAAIACAIFLMVNYLSYRHYRLFDWTSGKLYTLSEKTTNVLSSLEEPLTVYVFYQPRQRAYPYVTDLLREYAHASDKIRVEELDPDRDLARVKRLAKEFRIEALNVIVLEYGDKHRELSDAEMVEMDRTPMRFGGPPRIKSFSGEEAITSAILDLTQGKQMKLCFVSGHGEGSLTDFKVDGFSELARKIERENMAAEELVLVGEESVPADCDVLVVAGPTRPFTAEEIQKLQAYLGGGGKLLVMLDPLTETNLSPFLAEWGARVTDTIVVDPAKKLPFVDAANLYVNDFSDHEITQKLQNSAVLLFLAREVDAARGGRPGLEATSLLTTSPMGWGETDLTKTAFSFEESVDSKGPVSLAVAVKGPEGTGARMVVIGDSDFAANGQLKNMGNSDFFLNCVNWLGVREKLIAIGPKPFEDIKLQLNRSQMKRVFLFSVVVLPALTLVLGIVVWFRRRR